MRQPSPWNGVATSTARVAGMSSRSLTAVFGPRFARRTGAPGAAAIARYIVERGMRKAAQIGSADTADPCRDSRHVSSPLLLPLVREPLL